MNENLHLENNRTSGMGRLVLSILGITVTIGVVFTGGQGYSEWQRHQRLSENDEVMTERLVKLGQYYDLIHQLGDGKSDTVRQKFSLAMASEISQIHSTLGDASKNQQEFAEHICSMIAQDERSHPSYYQVGKSSDAPETPETETVTSRAKALDAGQK